MTAFEWTPSFCTGNEEIDRQNQMLLNMVNRLNNHLNEGPEMRLMVELFFDDLVRYTEHHFKAEERIMAEARFPESAQHCAQHEKLRDQVKAFRTKFKNNEANVSHEMMDFLKDWLIHHIQGSDVRLASHLGTAG